MADYCYMWACLGLLVVLAVLLLRRKELTKETLVLSLVGGIVGPPTDYFFFFRDYWQPPTTSGIAKPSIEDFLFGFVVVGLSYVLYMTVCGYKLGRKKYPSHHKFYVKLALTSLPVLVVLTYGLGIISIFATSMVFVGVGIILITMRPDLLKPALFSAFIMAVIVALLYMAMFDTFAKDYLSKYWLLYQTPLGKTILGHVPLSEIVWYSSWAFLGSISYPFSTGRPFVKLRSK